MTCKNIQFYLTGRKKCFAMTSMDFFCECVLLLMGNMQTNKLKLGSVILIIAVISAWKYCEKQDFYKQPCSNVKQMENPLCNLSEKQGK